MPGLYRGVSGLALGTGLWVGAAGLWNGATGLEDGGGGPSLNLTLTSTLDPRITFTRASSGTYFNSSGVLSTAATDTARFDYNPATLAAKGLLIEEARTNVFTYSEQFDNAAWAKVNATVTANAVAAPDSATTAGKFCSGATGTVERSLRQNSSFTNGLNYTQSVFTKAAEISAYGQNSGQGYGTVNQAPPTAGTATGALPLGATMQALPSGWYRGTISHGINVTGSRQNLFYISNVGGSATVPVGEGLYLWGAQEEVGAFATSYIPTVAASATREADIAAMTGSNFSSWWGTTTGTIVVQATSPASGTRIVWQADDGTANNRITIYTTGTTVMADVVSGGVTQASLNLGTITANTAFKVAMRYGANDFSASLNGAACVTDTSGTVPTVDRCRLGSDTTGNYLCGTIPALLAYRYGLSDGSLRSLST